MPGAGALADEPPVVSRRNQLVCGDQDVEWIGRTGNQPMPISRRLGAEPGRGTTEQDAAPPQRLPRRLEGVGEVEAVAEALPGSRSDQPGDHA